MQKKCSICGDDFILTTKKNSMCPSCSREYHREYYRKSSKEKKDIKVQRSKLRREKIRDEVDRMKGDAGCKICDENDPCCLDLHHLDPDEKEFNVSEAVRTGASWIRIKEEFEKCIVVCANCHRKIHKGNITI